MEILLKAAAHLGQRLIVANATVAVAESSTGGLISASLLAMPGASAYFRGGDIIYTAQSRAAFGITAAAMAGLRASTEPYAALLATHARARLGTVWSIAETGAAGPTGNRYGDAAGHVCLAVSGPVSLTRTIETASSDRTANMRAFAAAALALLDEAMTSAS